MYYLEITFDSFLPFIVVFLFLAIILTASWVVATTENELAPQYRFVVKPGFHPVSGKWMNATTLAQYYELDPGEYTVYDPEKKLELNDILLVPLNDAKYVLFKIEAVQAFRQQLVAYPYIYST